MAEKGFVIRSDCFSINMVEYMEIDKAFKIFVEKHPEALRHEHDLVPAPWTKKERRTGARHFKFIPNNSLGEFFAIWKDRLKMLEQNPT